MIPARSNRLLLVLLNNTSLILFCGVALYFSLLSPQFREFRNLENILIQSAAVGILATGMTFVLLTAGVDLSVGAIMFVAAAVGGKMILAGWAFPLALAAMLLVGLIYGWINALFVSRLRIMAFIVTLATLYLGRGLGLWITRTRAMNLPESFYELGASRLAGIPVPVMLLLVVVVAAHLVLNRTPYGRHVYAVGNDPEAARKAGINTRRIFASVYVVSGACAAMAAIVALSQAPAVSPNFGAQREFAAIAAAVLGGTSLFGGKGSVLPGTLLGAVLIQTVENGLNILNINPYLYPLITSAIIFFAVFTDSLRHGMLTRLSRRLIRVE